MNRSPHPLFIVNISTGDVLQMHQVWSSPVCALQPPLLPWTLESQAA